MSVEWTRPEFTVQRNPNYFSKEWCVNMAKLEEEHGDPEIGAGRHARDPSFSDSDIHEMMSAEEKRDRESRLKELDMRDPLFNEDYEEWKEVMQEYEHSGLEQTTLDQYNDPLWHPNRDREQD